MSPKSVLAWQTDRLEQQLQPWLPGVVVQAVPECASTNTVLLERAREAEGRFDPCLLVAERQTAGRGRMGRSWLAETGASLTFSLAWPLAAPDWSGLSLVVGLAVADALDPAAPRDREPGEPAHAGRPLVIALKWPNDLWLVPAHRHTAAEPAPGRDVRLEAGPETSPQASLSQGRKLGGILIETVSRGVQRTAVIGIGLNIRPLAPERAAALGREVACLCECEPAITAPAALARVALPLAQALRRFEQVGFAAFAAGYARRDALLGRVVATTDAQAPAGVAEGVGDDGALLLRSAGRLHRITSGEVSVRPLGAGVA